MESGVAITVQVPVYHRVSFETKTINVKPVHFFETKNFCGVCVEQFDEIMVNFGAGPTLPTRFLGLYIAKSNGDHIIIPISPETNKRYGLFETIDDQIDFNNWEPSDPTCYKNYTKPWFEGT